MDAAYAYIHILEAELVRTKTELARTTVELKYVCDLHDVKVIKYRESRYTLWYLRGQVEISRPQIRRTPTREGDPRIDNSLLMQKWLGITPDAGVIVYISLRDVVVRSPRIVSDEREPYLFHIMSSDGHIYATMTRKNARCVIRKIARLFADNLPVVDGYDI